MSHTAVSVVLPLRAASPGKSRLVAPRGVDHDALVQAMARDTLAAAAAVVGWQHLWVVGGWPSIQEHLHGTGAHLLPDPSQGLDAAVGRGLAAVWRYAPQRRWAVLLADLPSLAPQAFADVLADAAYGLCIAPDRHGTGTVLVTGEAGWPFSPSFGPDSATRHGRIARLVGLDTPGLRCDVDTRDDLYVAISLGVGRMTERALADAQP